MDTKELIQRGELAYQRVYEGKLKAELERTAWGKYVAINIDTGEHLVAETRREARAQFRARFPGAIAYLVRIGIPLQVA